MASILLAEDERDLNDLIAVELRQEGHEVVQAYDGLRALDAANARQMDLVIIDWMMPGIDGLTLCRRIRQRQLVPILMLTARSEEADVVLGLEVGADDYLTKPFRMRELMARIRAILRRNELSHAPASKEETHLAGGVRTNGQTRIADVDGEELDLTPREFDLLALFVANPGRAFSREYLLNRLWPSDYDVTDRTVDTHVQRIRKKLGDKAQSIQTVWGIGYRFAPAKER